MEDEATQLREICAYLVKFETGGEHVEDGVYLSGVVGHFSMHDTGCIDQSVRIEAPFDVYISCVSLNVVELIYLPFCHGVCVFFVL